MNLPNQIKGTMYQRDKSVDNFCDYYRCSIYSSGDVSKYRNMYPSHVVDDSNIEIFSTERVFNIRIPEGMLDDLVNMFNERMEEIQVRSSDPRLMKMYSEYITMLNLMK